MLKIFNSLKPFFDDNYRRINVREYAKIQGISPPSASKLLDGFYKEGLLNKEVERRYIYYYANRDDSSFTNLSRVYWCFILKKIGLINYFEQELINPVIILFGSFANAEVSSKSDIDIALFTISKKELDIGRYNDALKEVHLFMFKSREDVKNKNLLNNILNGFKISGRW